MPGNCLQHNRLLTGTAFLSAGAHRGVVRVIVADVTAGTCLGAAAAAVLVCSPSCIVGVCIRQTHIHMSAR